MSIIIIYAFTFAAVLLIAELILRRLFGRQRAAREVNERLERLKLRQDQSGAYSSLLQDRSLFRRGAGAFSPGDLTRLYRQSGLVLSRQRRIVYVLVILLGSFMVAQWIASTIWVQVPLALVICAATIVFLIVQIRAARIKKFVTQLPSAIDIIVRSLSAGHPLNAAIALVGREMPDPIGSEFGMLSDQLTFGLELDQAMLSMIDRVGADELNLLAVTVSVQRNTGGNLGEALENLSRMIRDRALLRGKIRAISAEGRITAVIMALFPAFLFLMIRTLVPTYFDPVWETGYGTQIVLGILAVMAFGAFILRRLVTFDF